jgi:hypothetical protein
MADTSKQAIFIKMVEVAKTYDEPLKTRFIDAAINFRLPYWDYFRPRAGPGNFIFPGVISDGSTTYPYDYSAPLIFTRPSVTVKFPPKGKPDSLPNPLHHYNFKAKTGQLSADEWKSFSGDVVCLTSRLFVAQTDVSATQFPQRSHSSTSHQCWSG